VFDDPAVLHYINPSPAAVLAKYSMLGRFADKSFAPEAADDSDDAGASAPRARTAPAGRRCCVARARRGADARRGARSGGGSGGDGGGARAQARPPRRE
jgi:hypothetical protein